MDHELIEKYKKELMRMYRSSPAAKAKYAAAPQTDIPQSNQAQEMPQNSAPERQSPQQGAYDPGTPYGGEDAADQNGRLTVMVTAISRIYPVGNAKVTVFTGAYEQPVIIDTDITDESGKTKTFSLPAVPRGLSMRPDPAEAPYTVYNILVEADGYADNLHINVPVFRGVTSLQRSNMTPLASAGQNTGPIVFNELSSFGL